MAVHVSTLEDFAAKLERDGNAAAAEAWRNHIPRLAGLDRREAGAFRRITSDCNQATAQVESEMARIKATHPYPLVEGTPVFAAFEHLWQREQTIVRGGLDRLREQLGPASFCRLDFYLSSVYGFPPLASDGLDALAWTSPDRLGCRGHRLPLRAGGASLKELNSCRARIAWAPLRHAKRAQPAPETRPSAWQCAH